MAKKKFWKSKKLNESNFEKINKIVPLMRAFGPSYTVWKGTLKSKREIANQYKFHFAYENAINITGYITEKIFDAFVAGNVPVYWGADDIDNYIPKECFIDRRSFSNHEELYKFLKNISEEEYLNYQRCIKKFLENESGEFTCKKFADVISSKIVEIINNKK